MKRYNMSKRQMLDVLGNTSGDGSDVWELGLVLYD